MAWYSSNWGYRLPVVVPAGAVGSTLSDFPVYVDLADAPAAAKSHFFAHVSASGADIVVTVADGATETAVEVTDVDTSAQHARLFFKAPSLSPTEATRFYVYYGNASAMARSAGHAFGRNAVWSNSFAAVYHLEQDPSGPAPQMIDATGNGYDLTTSNCEAADLVAAVVGSGLDVDGVNEQAASASLVLSGHFTIETLHYIDSLGSGQRWIAGENSQIVRNGTTMMVYLFADAGFRGPATHTLTAGVWQHLAGAYDGSTIRAWVDGVPGSNAFYAGSSEPGENDFSIGTSGSGTQQTDAKYDEVRVSTVARSDDWIAATSVNLQSPATFCSIGVVQTRYAAAVLDAADPLAYWRFSETAGSTISDFVGNHHGTAYNSPTLTTPGLVDDIDNDTACTFSEAMSQYVDVGGLGTLGSSAATTGVTILGWISTSEMSDRLVLHLSSGAGDTCFIEINRAGSGNLHCELADSSGNTLSGTTATSLQLNDGQTHMVAVVFDPPDATLTVYVDGQAQALAASVLHAGVDPADFVTGRIAAAANLSAYVDATLDEIAVYDAQLSAGQIAELYAIGQALIYADGAAQLTGDVDVSCSARLTRDAAADVGCETTVSLSPDLFAEAQALVAVTSSAAASGLLIRPAEAALSCSTSLDVDALLVRIASASLNVTAKVATQSVLSFIAAHIDFEVADWGEFDAEPTVTGVGAAIAPVASGSEGSDGLMRGSTAARVTLDAGETGAAVLTRTLAQTMPQLHVRIYLRHDMLDGGSVTVMQGLTSTASVAWTLAYDAPAREVVLTLSDGQSAAAALPDVLRWTCIGLAIDTAAGTAELLAGGLPAGALSAWAGALATAAIELGCIAQSAAASGAVDLDELLISSAYVGPVLASPVVAPASLFQAPASAEAWLPETY